MPSCSVLLLVRSCTDERFCVYCSSFSLVLWSEKLVSLRSVTDLCVPEVNLGGESGSSEWPRTSFGAPSPELLRISEVGDALLASYFICPLLRGAFRSDSAIMRSTPSSADGFMITVVYGTITDGLR